MSLGHQPGKEGGRADQEYGTRERQREEGGGNCSTSDVFLV